MSSTETEMDTKQTTHKPKVYLIAADQDKKYEVTEQKLTVNRNSNGDNDNWRRAKVSKKNSKDNHTKNTNQKTNQNTNQNTKRTPYRNKDKYNNKTKKNAYTEYAFGNDKNVIDKKDIDIDVEKYRNMSSSTYADMTNNDLLSILYVRAIDTQNPLLYGSVKNLYMRLNNFR